MASILVVYDTRYGQSAKVAARIESIVRARGHRFDDECAPGAHPIFVEDFDAVFVVAPVYNRRHPESIERFVCQHARYLATRPTAFISVSLGAAARLRFVRTGVRRISERLFQRCGWRPARALYTGGSIEYPIYTPSMRAWMLAAAFVFGLPADTTRRHELTDWASVEELVEAVLNDIEADHDHADAMFA